MSEMGHIAPPPAPIAPLVWIKERLEIDSGAHDDELLRLALSVTSALESAAGRTFVRRENVVVFADASALAAAPGVCALDIGHVTPMTLVHSVHVDADAQDAVDIAFGADQLLDQADWMLAPVRIVGSWTPARIVIRRGVRLPRIAAENTRIECDAGFTPHDGGDGFSVPSGQIAMPRSIEEAFIEQVSILWRRRSELHLRSRQLSAGGGGGNIAFNTASLAPQVVQALAPHATPAGALNMSRGEVTA